MSAFSPFLVLDLTRLLSATGRRSPTGLERFEYSTARWLVERSDLESGFTATAHGALRMLDRRRVLRFLDGLGELWREGPWTDPAGLAIERADAFLRGLPASNGPAVAPSRDPRWQAVRRMGRRLDGSGLRGRACAGLCRLRGDLQGRPLGLPSGRPVVYLRSSLDGMERAHVLAPLLRQPDTHLIATCHDTIPLDYPELVRPQLVGRFAQQLGALRDHFDAIVTGSHYSAERITAWLGGSGPAVDVLPYGTEPTGPVPDLATAVRWSPYFLMVSTIEARKNHHLVLAIWRRLAETLGENAPKLVIVGRRGWKVQEPIAIMDRADVLRGLVHEAGPVPDAALAVLRRHARAVLMPSFVEGYGLPVVEALAAGTPVLASDIPAFREIAGGTAELIDPLDGRGWLEAVLDYAGASPTRLAEARARVAAYRIPGADEHFGALRGVIEDVVQGRRRAPRASAEGSRRLAEVA